MCWVNTGRIPTYGLPYSRCYFGLGTRGTYWTVRKTMTCPSRGWRITLDQLPFRWVCYSPENDTDGGWDLQGVSNHSRKHMTARKTFKALNAQSTSYLLHKWYPCYDGLPAAGSRNECLDPTWLWGWWGRGPITPFVNTILNSTGRMKNGKIFSI